VHDLNVTLLMYPRVMMWGGWLSMVLSSSERVREFLVGGKVNRK
jgi:hypothetical protein